MNGTFEDRLLAELKAEIATRAAQGRARAPRRMTARRLLAGAGVVTVAAAAAVAVPLVIESDTPAYALTKNPDGSINLKINEFRDSAQVEKDLAGLGVSADITYLPLGKRCGNDRAPFIKEDNTGVSKKEALSEDPAVRARIRRKMEGSPSYRAIRPAGGITIYPRYIKPGQTVMIEVWENPVEPTLDRPGVAWGFSGRLTDGPVKPCRVVDDPSAFDVGDATPPPGS